MFAALLALVLPERRAARSARAGDAPFRAAFDASPNGVLIVDVRGVVSLANAEAGRIFGYAPEKLHGLSVETLVPAGMREAHAGFREDYMREPRVLRGKGHERVMRAVRRDGVEFAAEISIHPVDSGGETSIMCVVSDISERQAMLGAMERQRAELERSNEDLARFAYVASHDLQEPLRSVASYAALLDSRYAPLLDERGRRYLEHVCNGARRMQQLTDELLDYARADGDGARTVPTNMNEALAAVLALLEPRLEQEGASVTHDPLPCVLADSIGLQLVLRNVLANALKYRRGEAPVVHLTASRAGADWLVSVRDNGIGLPPESTGDAIAMHERFGRESSHVGHGVGLAIARRLIERHGGRLWLSSPSGDGTTVSLLLRAAEETTA